MKDLKEIIADNNKAASKGRAVGDKPAACPKHPGYDGQHFPARPCAHCFTIWRAGGKTG